MSVKTSSQFEEILHNRIREIDNRGPSIWQRMLEMKPFGFEPVPALGVALAMLIIIGASYLLLNQDSLPNVNLNKLSTNSQQNIPQNFQPSVITPKQNLPSMADSDTTVKSNTKHLDKRIKLVGGK